MNEFGPSHFRQGFPWACRPGKSGKSLFIPLIFALLCTALPFEASGQTTDTALSPADSAEQPSAKKSKARPDQTRTSLKKMLAAAKLPKPSRPAVGRLEGQASELYLSAKELMAQGEFEQAGAKLEEALTLSPASYDIYEALAKVAISRGKLAEALDYISTAGQIDPDHMEVYILEGRIAASRRQQERAIQSYILALLCSQATDDNVQTGRALLELSSLLVKEGYWPAAIEAYERLSAVLERTDPADREGTVLHRLAESPGQIWVAIGKLYEKLDQSSRAAKAYSKAQRISAKDLDVLADCARGLADVGRFRQALAIIDELVEHRTQRALAARLLIRVRHKQGKDEQIPEDLQRLRARYGNDSSIAIVLASYYRQVGQTDKARKTLIEAAKDDRGFTATYVALSNLEAQQGRRAQAVRWLALMVRARPSAIVEAHWRIRKIAGDKQQAAELFKELSVWKSLKRDFSLAWAAATVAESGEMLSQANTYYQTAVNLQPGFRQLYVYLVRFQLRQGRADQALATIEQAEKAGVQRASFYHLEGLAYVLKDDLDSAITSLEAAVGAEADNQAARELLASALFSAGRPDETAQHLQTLVAGNPNDQSLLRQLMLAYMADGYPNRAARTAQEFMSSHRLHTPTALTAAKAFLAAKMPAEAVAALERISVPREYMTQWQELFLEALVLSGRLQQAQEELKAWLEQLNPGGQRAGLAGRLAVILFDSGQKELAQKLAWDELQVNHQSPMLLEMVIHMLLDREDYARAAELTEVWLVEKQDAPTVRLRTKVLLAQKKYDQASRDLEELLSKEPTDIDSLHLLAHIYESTGEDEQAGKQYEKILEAKPDDVWANNNLGFELADNNQRLDEARRMIRTALRGAWTEASVVDSMGWVLYKRGRFGQALGYLSRSVRLADKPVTELLEHLGDAHYRLEETDKADDAWKQALQVEQAQERPDQEQVKRLQKKLEMIESQQEPPVAWSAVDEPAEAGKAQPKTVD